MLLSRCGANFNWLHYWIFSSSLFPFSVEVLDFSIQLPEAEIADKMRRMKAETKMQSPQVCLMNFFASLFSSLDDKNQLLFEAPVNSLHNFKPTKKTRCPNYRRHNVEGIALYGEAFSSPSTSLSVSFQKLMCNGDKADDVELKCGSIKKNESSSC